MQSFISRLSRPGDTAQILLSLALMYLQSNYFDSNLVISDLQQGKLRTTFGCMCLVGAASHVTLVNQSNSEKNPEEKSAI